MTYAERLQAEGVSWKVYEESNNFGDNALAWFKNFKGLGPGNPLYDRGLARQKSLVEAFSQDVKTDNLPQVSWIVAPSYLSEHPDYKPAYGETLTALLLEVLASNPSVYAKTAFIISYDENGGFYDHLPPPTPPASINEGLSTASVQGEIYKGKPIGLGFRVPMIIVSPWTRGGWVCSQVFDHTSQLRFVEARFGVEASNISPWRRAVCGDLTSAFDFRGKGQGWPSLPSTVGYRKKAALECSLLPPPQVPKVQAMPAQEPGTKPARALPYVMNSNGYVDLEARRYVIDFFNKGQAAVVFQVYTTDKAEPPRRYTVEPGKRLSDSWSDDSSDQVEYKLQAHGPNGFLRVWNGVATPDSAIPEVSSRLYPAERRVHLVLRNSGMKQCTIEVLDGYKNTDKRVYVVQPGSHVSDDWDLSAQANWYDLTATTSDVPSWLRRLAGHVEDGRPSLTDPG